MMATTMNGITNVDRRGESSTCEFMLGGGSVQERVLLELKRCALHLRTLDSSASPSTLRREPTWSQAINFDDGFEEALASSYDIRGEQTLNAAQEGGHGIAVHTVSTNPAMPGGMPLADDYRVSKRVVSGASDGTLPAIHHPDLSRQHRLSGDVPRLANATHQRQYSSPLASARPLSSADMYASQRTADANASNAQPVRMNGNGYHTARADAMRSTEALSHSGSYDQAQYGSTTWDPRPASAMSFQTALSGGTAMFSSSEDSDIDEREEAAARQAVNLWPDHSQLPLGQRLQPWLDNPHFGSGSGHMYDSGTHSVASGAESRWTDAREDFAPPPPPKENNRFSAQSFASPSSRFEDLPDRTSFVSASSYITPEASPLGFSAPLPSVPASEHRQSSSRDYLDSATDPQRPISSTLNFDPHQPFEHRRDVYTTAPLPEDPEEEDEAAERVLDRHTTVKQHSRNTSNAMSSGSVPSAPSLPSHLGDTTITGRRVDTHQSPYDPLLLPIEQSRASSVDLSGAPLAQLAPAGRLSKVSTLAEDVIPPPLPEAVVEEQRAHARAHSSSGTFVPVPVVAPSDGAPVSDFRKKPLAEITPQTRAEGVQALNDFQPDIIASIPVPSNRSVLPSGRGHLTPSSHSRRGSEQLLSFAKPGESALTSPAHPALAQHRRGSSGNVLPKAALAEAPQQANVTVSTRNSVSSDTPSREPSPPPEGEIEARAEWEGRQLKLQERMERERDNQTKEKKRAAIVGNMKVSRPLQYVVDENFTNSPLDTTITGGPLFRPEETAELTRGKSAQMPPRLSADSQGEQASAMSTQQLQRQQRRSVGALNLTSSSADLAAGGSSGPYPAFSSPTTAPTRVTGTGRQYPGLMPQRSLVPPFELQQRPDGLLSGLIGPDGVRRSVNDPEVCLECMMRDEDMIDVNVVGKGLWERESDRDFEEALRAEEATEREAFSSRNGRFSASVTHDSAEQSSNTHEAPSLTSAGSRPAINGKPAVRVKKVGKSDPLTAERLKLHTQMNIPASSHRWRTLQTFLAQQAKYIAMDQRARAVTDAERRAADVRLAAARERERAHLASAAEYDTRPRPPQRDTVVGGRISRLAPAPAQIQPTAGTRPRSASAATPRNLVLDDEPLSPEERVVKERDVAAAREARRKMAQSEGVLPPRGITSGVSPTPLARSDAPTTLMPEEESRRFSSPMPAPDSAGAHSVPRRSAAPQSPSRVGSSQELRTIPHSMSPRDGELDNLAPPMRPYGRFGKQGSSATSQVSAIQSGSMVDMHVGLEDRTELRIAQSGFVPGPSLLPQSPNTTNRAFYGFANEGESRAFSPAESLGDKLPTSPPKSPLVSRFDDDVGVAARSSREEDVDGLGKRKKKGLRGFLNKMTGSSSNGNNTGHVAADDPSSYNERDVFGRPSQSSSNPPSKNDSLELAPPPALGGLLARGRGSASSLLEFHSSFESDRARAPSPAVPGPSHFQGSSGPNIARKDLKAIPPALENSSRALPQLPEIQTHGDLQPRSVQPNRASQQSLPGAPTPPSPSSRATSMLSFTSKPAGRAPPVPTFGSSMPNGTSGETGGPAQMGGDRSSVTSRGSSRKDNLFQGFQSSPRNTQQFSVPSAQHPSSNGGSGSMAEARWPSGVHVAGGSSFTTPGDSSTAQSPSEGPPRSASRTGSYGALASIFNLDSSKQAGKASRKAKKESARMARSGSNTPSATSSGAGHDSSSLGGVRQSSSSQPVQPHHNSSPQQVNSQNQGLRVDAPPHRAASPGPRGRSPSPGPRPGHLSFGNDHSTPDYSSPSPGKEKSSRTSKIMKITMNAFGKKKRDSNVIKADRHGPSDGRASSMAGMILRKRKSETAFERVTGPMFTDEDDDDDDDGLAPPNRNAVFGSTNGRPRVVSSPHDPRSYGGRSQSAMGMLPSQRFVKSGRSGSGRSFDD